MVRYVYNLVMDPNRHPLQALPKMVRFQYMVILAYMWPPPHHLASYTTRSDTNWIVERHGYQTPAAVRAAQLAPLPVAA